MGSNGPSTPRFFVLEQDRVGGRHEAHCYSVDPVRGDAPRCPKCGVPIGSLTWLPPLRAELELYGDALGDVIRGPTKGLLVSERFLEAFLKEGLVGLKDFHPVEIVRLSKKFRSRKAVEVPRYFFAPLLQFSGAAVDEARSHLLRGRPATCDWCRLSLLHRVRGFCLEEGSWTGEDIFRARGLSGTYIVSERFAQFAQEHDFKSVHLIPTEQYLFPKPSSIDQ